MRQSKAWSRRAGKRLKGNHRRKKRSAGLILGYIGNTYVTPSKRRGVI